MLCVNPYARPVRQPSRPKHVNQQASQSTHSILVRKHNSQHSPTAVRSKQKKRRKKNTSLCAAFTRVSPHTSLCHKWVKNARQTFETNRCRCSRRNMAFNKACMGLDRADRRVLACHLCPLETSLAPFSHSNRVTVLDSTQVVEKINEIATNTRNTKGPLPTWPLIMPAYCYAMLTKKQTIGPHSPDRETDQDSLVTRQPYLNLSSYFYLPFASSHLHAHRHSLLSFLGPAPEPPSQRPA
jgi:hypothetical protein